jgi:hypothetical protein
MKITRKNQVTADRYRATVPKQLGDLHERMRYLMQLGSEAELWKTHNDLWHALHDLEVEVSFHEPAHPPFGKRIVSSILPD